jgi:HEPN domain-containing protein
MKEFEKWFKKAESDLYTVQLLLNTENSQPDICCFHCQQAAEKYLKSFFVSRQLDFPKTHDLELLIKLIVLQKPNFDEILPNALALTNYGVLPRYPDDTYEPSVSDAQQAFKNAIIIKEFVLKNFFD